MSTEALQLLCVMDKNKLEAQIGIQCAPLLAGIKISNLLTIPLSMKHQVSHIFRETEIQSCLLYESDQKVTFFLYRKQELEWALKSRSVREMMESMGYSLNNTERILRKVACRYEAHMKLRAEFPHELGLLLGYPPQDVAGFILHKGKDFLYSGYWKVYGNLSESLRRFQAFDLAREQVVHMMSDGTSIRQILAFFAQENGYLYRSQQLANC